MHRLFVLAAIAAVTVTSGVSSASAKSLGSQFNPQNAGFVRHEAGGPIRHGHMCWADVDTMHGYGYWDECESDLQFPRAKSQSTRINAANGDGGGGAGGGLGGGGGGNGGR